VIVSHLGRSATQRAVEAPGPTSGWPPTRQVADRLLALAELRGSGAITEEEYAARRATILDHV
jgi:hypothetical protein